MVRRTFRLRRDRGEVSAWDGPSVTCAMIEWARSRGEDSGLSFVEYYVLAGLSDQPDHTLRMSNLAVLANSELSRLSHLIRRLEKRGLVRREPDPSDGRFTHAILTDAGLAHLEEAAPRHVEQVRRLVFDVLDLDEQRALREAATKITSHLVGSC